MADEQLFHQIVGQFSYNEPTEEELEAELERLTGVKGGGQVGKSAVPKTDAIFAAVVVPADSVTDWNVDNAVVTDDDLNNPELLKEMERLGITEPADNSTSAISATTAISAKCATIADKSQIVECEPRDTREELKRLAIQAKREGRLEDAKTHLQRLKAVDNVNQGSIDDKIEKVTELAKQANRDSDVKLRALALKKAGDLQGALNLLKQSTVQSATVCDLKVKYKLLFDRLSRQAKACDEATKYYTRIKDMKSAKLFSDRRRSADTDMQFLLAELKAEREPPTGEEIPVSFETQLMDDGVKEKDMLIHVDTSKTVLPNNKSTYKLKVIFECASPGEQEKIIPLTQESMSFQNQMTRDIRQQKFFEHRRLKFDLVHTEKTFFVFTQDTIVASGHVKLQPLCTNCNVKAEVRLVDSTIRRHSCVINVEIKLRHPITLKDPVKHDQMFIYFSTGRNCGYAVQAPSGSNELLVSYVVIEKEIERLSLSSDPNAQVRIIELEGMRDELQLQVQTGQLTMQDYLRRVEECLSVTKKRCVECKRQNDLEQAKGLLVNIKLMEEEIREAMENE